MRRILGAGVAAVVVAVIVMAGFTPPANAAPSGWTAVEHITGCKIGDCGADWRKVMEGCHRRGKVLTFGPRAPFDRYVCEPATIGFLLYLYG